MFMYLPTSFAEDRPEALADLIARHPLGLLLTTEGDEIQASHLPLLLQPATTSAPALLRGHLALANPHGRKLDGATALVVFQGPEAYISPSNYPSKQRDPRHVPTWNYAVVHARGRVRVLTEAPALLDIVDQLATQFERQRAEPWSLAQAPRPYIDNLLRGIIGIEITVTSLQGKWKMSQNRLAEDAAGVAVALRSAPSERAREVSQLVEDALARRPETK